MLRTYDEWLVLLASLELLWIHDEKPSRPHALLTSGLHSSGFFNGGKLVYDMPRLTRELCYDFAELRVRPLLQTVPKVHRVIGPAFGAVPLAASMGDALDVACGFTVPKGEGESKTFELDKRFDVKGMNILKIEDTITTGDSVQKSVLASEAKGGIVLPLILALCNRSGLTHIGARLIVAMFDKPMPTWDPAKEECPYCKMGSEAIRPKEAGNWARLTAP